MGPGHPRGHPTPHLHMDIHRESRVVEFIDPESKEWNSDFLSNFVSEDERVAISHIHVGPVWSPDKFIWLFERTGAFSVKSVYRWSYDRHHSVNTSHHSSSQSLNPRVWDWVWSYDVPPKMRNFLWRAIRDACATNFNLYQHRCATSPLCPICAEGDETVEHILLLCS
ncbi:hypothetical protein ACFX1S_009188 [Malus domestica]